MNIYVGNLSYDVDDAKLKQAFEAYGEVSSATVIIDRMSGKSKGFGFVEMSSDDDARKAIDGLNEQPLEGRPLRVNEARPREERPRRDNY